MMMVGRLIDYSKERTPTDVDLSLGEFGSSHVGRRARNSSTTSEISSDSMRRSSRRILFDASCRGEGNRKNQEDDDDDFSFSFGLNSSSYAQSSRSMMNAHSASTSSFGYGVPDESFGLEQMTEIARKSQRNLVAPASPARSNSERRSKSPARTARGRRASTSRVPLSSSPSSNTMHDSSITSVSRCNTTVSDNQQGSTLSSLRELFGKRSYSGRKQTAKPQVPTPTSNDDSTTTCDADSVYSTSTYGCGSDTIPETSALGYEEDETMNDSSALYYDDGDDDSSVGYGGGGPPPRRQAPIGRTVSYGYDGDNDDLGYGTSPTDARHLGYGARPEDSSKPSQEDLGYGTVGPSKEDLGYGDDSEAGPDLGYGGVGRAKAIPDRQSLGYEDTPPDDEDLGYGDAAPEGSGSYEPASYYATRRRNSMTQGRRSSLSGLARVPRQGGGRRASMDHAPSLGARQGGGRRASMQHVPSLDAAPPVPVPPAPTVSFQLRSMAVRRNSGDAGGIGDDASVSVDVPSRHSLLSYTSQNSIQSTQTNGIASQFPRTGRSQHERQSQDGSSRSRSNSRSHRSNSRRLTRRDSMAHQDSTTFTRRHSMTHNSTITSCDFDNANADVTAFVGSRIRRINDKDGQKPMPRRGSLIAGGW